MPWIVPFIPLIAAGGSLAGAGVAAYDANNASIDQKAAQAQQQKALLQSQQSQANQANLTKQEAVLSQEGQAQQQTGGSLTDSGTSSLTDLLAGYPGFSGSSGGGSSPAIAPTSLGGTGSSTGAPDIGAILAALRNGGADGGGSFGSAPGSPSSISGGNWQSQPAPPQQTFELSNPVLS